MNQLWFEFGAQDLAPVVLASRTLLGELESWSIEVVKREDEESMNDQPSTDSLAEVLTTLEDGTLGSITLSEASGPRNTFLILTRPKFAGSQLALWTGTVFRYGVYSEVLLRPFLGINDLTLAVLSLQDTIELDRMGAISVKNFPWDDWRLLRAAVRRPDGAWEEREGPAAEQLKGHRSRPGEASRP